MQETTNVKDLIESIKKEGIEEANNQASKIISEAKEEASKIIQKANQEAQELKENADSEAHKLKIASEQAISQAGRNLILSLKQEITKLFNKIIEQNVSNALNEKEMNKLITKIIKDGELSNSKSNIEILLGEENFNNLKNTMIKDLKTKFKKGVDIKPLDHIEAGFRIGEKDGNMHLDFTEKGIAEILSQYLNPKLQEFINA